MGLRLTRSDGRSVVAAATWQSRSFPFPPLKRRSNVGRRVRGYALPRQVAAIAHTSEATTRGVAKRRQPRVAPATADNSPPLQRRDEDDTSPRVAAATEEIKLKILSYVKIFVHGIDFSRSQAFISYQLQFFRTGIDIAPLSESSTTSSVVGLRNERKHEYYNGAVRNI